MKGSLWFLSGAAAAAVVLTYGYRQRKKDLRRCRWCGAKNVSRIPKVYKTRPPSPKTLENRLAVEKLLERGYTYWETYMFKVCKRCGEV